MHDSLYDKNRNLITTPHDRGRLAFWSGRQLYANPFMQAQADEWRQGWLLAEQDFRDRGGRTEQDRVTLRPTDLPKAIMLRKTTARGAARKSLRLRRQGIGWA